MPRQTAAERRAENERHAAEARNLENRVKAMYYELLALADEYHNGGDAHTATTLQNAAGLLGRW